MTTPNLAVRFAAIAYVQGKWPDPQGMDIFERAALGTARTASERSAGFAAVKLAARALLGRSDGVWAVRRREHATPLLLLDGVDLGWHVSVAHAGGLAVAAVALPPGEVSR